MSLHQFEAVFFSLWFPRDFMYVTQQWTRTQGTQMFTMMIRGNICDAMFFWSMISLILAWRSTYVLCIPRWRWQPKRDNVKEETECERCPVQLAVRWKKMQHHRGSFAISLEWGSWCRMEIGWFTDMMALGMRKKNKKIKHVESLTLLIAENIFFVQISRKVSRHVCFVIDIFQKWRWIKQPAEFA